MLPKVGEVRQVSRNFSKNIYRHGFVRDTTMEGYTRERNKQYVNMNRRESNSKKISDEFKAEARRIKALQTTIAKCQQDMALIAMSKYCATHLQSVFRGYIARKKLHRLKSIRLIFDWLTFRVYFIRRYLTSILITRYAKKYLKRKENARKRVNNLNRKAARAIVTWIRKYFVRRRIDIRKYARECAKDFILLGTSRARVSFLNGEKYLFAQKKVIYYYRRAKRIQMLKSINSCKYIFYSLFGRKFSSCDNDNRAVSSECVDSRAMMSLGELESNSYEGNILQVNNLTSINFEIKTDILQYIKKKYNFKTLKELSSFSSGVGSCTTTSSSIMTTEKLKNKLPARSNVKPAASAAAVSSARRKSWSLMPPSTITEIENALKLSSILEAVMFISDLIVAVRDFPCALDISELHEQYLSNRLNLGLPLLRPKLKKIKSHSDAYVPIKNNDFSDGNSDITGNSTSISKSPVSANLSVNDATSSTAGQLLNSKKTPSSAPPVVGVMPTPVPPKDTQKPVAGPRPVRRIQNVAATDGKILNDDIKRKQSIIRPNSATSSTSINSSASNSAKIASRGSSKTQTKSANTNMLKTAKVEGSSKVMKDMSAKVNPKIVAESLVSSNHMECPDGSQYKELNAPSLSAFLPPVHGSNNTSGAVNKPSNNFISESPIDSSNGLMRNRLHTIDKLQVNGEFGATNTPVDMKINNIELVQGSVSLLQVKGSCDNGKGDNNNDEDNNRKPNQAEVSDCYEEDFEEYEDDFDVEEGDVGHKGSVVDAIPSYNVLPPSNPKPSYSGGRAGSNIVSM